MIRCAPPRGIGQPTAWPVIPSTSPNAALGGWVRGSVACADMPVNSARARASRKASRARTAFGSTASIPNRASISGFLGGRSGARRSGASRSKRETNGSISRCQAAPSRPRPAAVAAVERCIRIAEPSSNGWASGIGGWTHSRP